MGWIVISVLVGVIFWTGIGLWIWAKGRDENLRAAGHEPSSDLMPPSVGLYAAGATVVLWVLISAFFMVHTVGQREVAIVYNFSGTIAGKKDPGVVTKTFTEYVPGVGINSGGVSIPTGSTKYALAIKRSDGSFCSRRLKKQDWLAVQEGETYG